MPTIIENINSIIGTKNDLGDIIRENNVVVPDTFDQYPAAIRSAIAAGSVVDQDTINSYISTYLNTYNYIDQNELSSNSYATQTYVANYVNEHGSSVVIDENIIPKENNTYTLGNNTYRYSNTYSYNYWSGGSRMYADDYALDFEINGNKQYRMFPSAFRCWSNNGANLGSSDTRWNNTYTSYLYTNVDGSLTDIGYYLSYNIGNIELLLENI